MNLLLASVYDDTWSSTTWTLVLTAIILGVVGLLVGFIALVHHSIEHADDHRTPTGTTPAVPANDRTRIGGVSHA